MRAAALLILAGWAHADSAAQAVRIFGAQPMCDAPQHEDLHGTSAAEYERHALSTFRKRKVFPLWKAAFAFRRSQKTTHPVLVREPGLRPNEVSSFAALQPPPIVGLPSQCSRGCCDMMREEGTSRWVRRICFDEKDQLRFLQVEASAPPEALKVLEQPLALPPKTPEDVERRRELEANPERALERLEQEAHDHQHGRWHRDACLPLFLTGGVNEAIFCLLYLPEGREPLRPALQQYLVDHIPDGLSPRSRARLPLVMSGDPKLRRIHEIAMKETGAFPKSRARVRWWADSSDTFVSVERPPKGNFWGTYLLWCDGPCCRYHNDGVLPCPLGARANDWQVITDICFDDDGQATDVWSYTDGEEDRSCVEDER